MVLKAYTLSLFRFRKIRIYYLLLILAILSAFLFIFQIVNIHTNQHKLLEIKTPNDINNVAKINRQCFASEIKFEFEKWKSESAQSKHPRCYDSRFLSIQNDGTVEFDYEYLLEKNIEILQCNYSVIKKFGKDDFEVPEDTWITIGHNQKVDTSEEFFKFKCKTNTHRTITGI